jgi:hypothetical protein
MEIAVELEGNGGPVVARGIPAAHSILPKLRRLPGDLAC